MVELKVILCTLKVKDDLQMRIIGLFLGLTAGKVLVGRVLGGCYLGGESVIWAYHASQNSPETKGYRSEDLLTLN